MTERATDQQVENWEAIVGNWFYGCGDSDIAHDIIDALRAERAHATHLEQQARQPLGYVVAFEGPGGPTLYATGREIIHDDDDADTVLAAMRRDEPCMDFQLYEVRARHA